MSDYAKFLELDRDYVYTAIAHANGASKDADICEIVNIPKLPSYATVDTSMNEYACGWLDEFVNFSRKMSPRAYDGFHEAIGLWLMSTVAARRVKLTLGVKNFYPSLYIALTAPTTIFSKSTTVNTGYRILKAAGVDFLLTPDDSTPQAFINDMAGHIDPSYAVMTSEQKKIEENRLAFASKCGWFYEEFGMKLEAMMRAGGFMADFRGMLRVLDDGKETYVYKTMTRRDEVNNPYLSLLANLTPADLRPHAKNGSSLWGDGFLARFAFVSPPPQARPNRGRFPETETELPLTIVNPLRVWHQRLGIPSVVIDEIWSDGKATGDYSVSVDERQPFNMMIERGVLDSFYNYHDALLEISANESERGNDDLSGSYGRFSEKAMRIAILIASINNEPSITPIHWARAQTITESWRESLHNLKDHLSESTPSLERKEHEQILKIIRKYPDGASVYKISRHTRKYSSAEISDIIKRLITGGDVKVCGKTKRGTLLYKTF